ncbi:hypothetical protein DICVIV_04405 [Dictyocaulus viviparus]|uniref:Neurotransmitter-gated ion-channel ligand-binding domain-containing protein n=1 Tax=Dictyocaulus viviparus TaxID=29172 RepID=A0A0D8XXT7_DICVI|nr:hypothetical protein DICVIV_04405 [Dictyocaulus viviparus]
MLSLFSIQIFLCACLVESVSSSEDEFRLIQDLRNNYDPIERPVRNHSEPVQVHLRILLQQLVDVYYRPPHHLYSELKRFENPKESILTTVVEL